MATLADRLNALTVQADALRNAATEQDLLQALRTRAAQTAKRKEALQECVNLAARLEHLGVAKKGMPRATAALRSKPKALGTQLAASQESVLEASQWDASFLGVLDTFSSKVAEVAAENWRLRVDGLVPPVSDGMLLQFERTGFSPAVREIKAASARIRDLRARVPDSDGALEEVARLGASISKTLRELDTVPSGVRTFLGKAASSDATIGDLTEEVTEWLRQHDMLKHIRLGLR